MPQSPVESARIVDKLARAVQAAHDAGIVHRDLKPGNVLFDAAGEPRVTDFGLAKRGTSDLTRTGAIMGTPAYMAPEQARGQTKFVGPAADLYALGVILFECLTGTLPFTADDTVGLIMKVASEEPPRPRSVNPAIPRDLELVCLHCLAKEPHERYATAAALADDLRRFAAGESVTVRSAGPVERTAKWARRNPTRAAAWGLSATVLALAGFGATVGVLYRQAEAERGRADGLRTEAEQARDEADRQRAAAVAARDAEAKAKDGVVRLSYARNVDLAYREYQADNLDRARALLEACPKELQGWEWGYVHRLCHAHLFECRRPGDEVTAAEYSRDERRILTRVASDRWRVWDAETGRLITGYSGAVGSILSLAIHPAATVVATADRTGRVSIWDAETGQRISDLTDLGKNGTRLAFDATGTRLLVWLRTARSVGLVRPVAAGHI